MGRTVKTKYSRATWSFLVFGKRRGGLEVSLQTLNLSAGCLELVE
jgi:hypothetical protein